MKFILNGKEVELHPAAGKAKGPQRQAKTKKVHDPADADLCLGYAVVGFSVEHLKHGKAMHELRIQEALACPGAPPVPPWDQDAYMRTARPRRVHPAPYELADAADVAADLARKAGWLAVRVEPLYRRDLTPKPAGQTRIE